MDAINRIESYCSEKIDTCSTRLRAGYVSVEDKHYFKGALKALQEVSSIIRDFK